MAKKKDCVDRGLDNVRISQAIVEFSQTEKLHQFQEHVLDVDTRRRCCIIFSQPNATKNLCERESRSIGV